MPGATTFADRLAEAVLSRFDNLPSKYKPSKDANHVSKWIPLSGIIFEYENGRLECISLATGMKCLPAKKMPLAKGRILHDSHAEILALRAFNHFLLHESLTLLRDETEDSKFLVKTGNPELPFTIHHGIKIHMYCSEAPCGDSSMELIMGKQADPTPWAVPVSDEQLLGRGHFSELGVVRRKPARGDSPETLSKSCSDKLALKQCMSILSSHTSCFISPENAYLASMVIPTSQYSPKAIERCFGNQGRLKALDGSSWPTEYSFRPFKILTTTTEFSFSRRSIPCNGSTLKGSNMAIIWNPVSQEIIINGILQGRKQTDPNCASTVSRSRIVAQISDFTNSCSSHSMKSYTDFRRSHSQLLRRAEVKTKAIQQALVGWVTNFEYDFDI